MSTDDQRTRLSPQRALSGLRAAGETTRLRLLALLAASELNVKDLTQILGQSQPRLSRHLKLMAEAGLIRRFREGSWVIYRLTDGEREGALGRAIVDALDPDDPVLARDRARAEAVRLANAEAAQDYFRSHAAEWDRIRVLHVAEDDVEQAIVQAIGTEPFDDLVDLGTGTGRMLELLAGTAGRGVGIDLNRDMLAIARAKLDRGRLSKFQARHGDLFDVPLPDRAADVVVLHQVLHFLDEPERAIAEAARLLKPGGRLLIVDFAAHDLEFLRDAFAHRRLGFDGTQIARWIEQAGLKLTEERRLEPKPGTRGDKLTVCLWLGSDAQESRKAPRREDVEVAA